MNLLAMVSFLLGAVATAEQVPEGPYVLVLGTAQDAGLPQIGCNDECCTVARADTSRRRLVTSLLIADPRDGRRWLMDATPDLRQQVEVAKGHPRTRNMDGPRPPLFDGVFLTHAHMGHYAGLLQLGPEAYGVRDMPLYGTPSMQEYLTTNGPWSLLFETGALISKEMKDDVALELAPDLTVTPIQVPHRREFTDTVAFVVRGPERAILYLPDIDKWERWERRIEDVIATVDVALVDATFFADGEIPGRSIDQIPHPFISESMERFAPLPASERQKIVFTHLNHTNPAANPDSDAARQVREAGMSVAADGMVIEL